MDGPTRRLQSFHRTTVCIAACFLLMLASCESGPRSTATTFNQNHSATASVPTATPGPGEYVYSSPAVAMYLALNGIPTGSVSGQLQLVQIVYDSYHGYSLESNHDSVSGTMQNGQVQIYTQRWGTITGTYTDSSITLNIPLKNGGVGTFTFTPGSSDAFNTDVAQIQNSINGANTSATTSTNATATTNSQQQAVSDANTAVGNDLSSLKGYIADLNQAANFDSVFSSYAQTWQQMQNDYQTEVNDSHNGCANGNNGTVQSDAGTVQSDEGSIQSDDGSYDSQKASIDGPYGNVQSLMATLKSDWQALQQAVANNSSGTPGSNYAQSDIDSAIASGNNTLSNADNVVKKAKDERAGYDNEANNLNNKAQALPGQMGC